MRICLTNQHRLTNKRKYHNQKLEWYLLNHRYMLIYQAMWLADNLSAWKLFDYPLLPINFRLLAHLYLRYHANQGAIIRVLTHRRYANITVWYFFVFSHVPRRYAELLLSAYLFFAGTTWPFQVGISCVWDVLAWNMIALMALRNVGVGCLK